MTHEENPGEYNLTPSDFQRENGHTFVPLTKLGLHHAGMSCLDCGIMRRPQGGNQPCKGPARVTLRTEQTEGTPVRAKAVIVGPAEPHVKNGTTYYRPCVLYSPCTPLLGIPCSNDSLSEEQCLEILDDVAREAQKAGYRVIRVKSMAERNAILTFVREAVEHARDTVVSDLQRFEDGGHGYPASDSRSARVLMDEDRTPCRRREAQQLRWDEPFTSAELESRIDAICGCKGVFACNCVSVFGQARRELWYEKNTQSHTSKA